MEQVSVISARSKPLTKIQALRCYKELTGAAWDDSFLQHSAAKILEKVWGRAQAVPVSVRRMAEALSIETRLTFDQMSPEGKTEYESSLGKFVVYLRRRRDRPVQDSNQGKFLDSLSVRERFTFAHEVAHTLFFVKEDDLWVRALKKVLDRTSPQYQRVVSNSLHGLEERLCNEIAARVLIPQTFVQTSLCNWLDRKGWNEKLPNLLALVDWIAKTCRVSALVSLARTLKVARSVEPTVPENFIVLVINISPNFSAPHGGMKIVFSYSLGKIGKIIFPGLEPIKLGYSFKEFCDKTLRDQTSVKRGTLRLPLTLKKADSQSIEALLEGYWTVLGRPNQYNRAMIWGLLDV